MRFTQYLPASEHHASLSAALPGEGHLWFWVPRHNPAAAHPTDFGLLALATGEAKRIGLGLSHLQAVRDVHADKRLSGSLLWSPEGPLAGAFADSRAARQASSEGSSGSAASDTPAATARGLRSDAAAAAAAEGGKEEAAFDFSVQRGPGRPITRFMMEDEDTDDEDSPLSDHSKAGNAAVDGQSQGMDHTSGGERDLLGMGRDVQEQAPEQQWEQQREQRRRNLQRKTGTITSMLDAEVIWQQGFSGKHIKVRPTLLKGPVGLARHRCIFPQSLPRLCCRRAPTHVGQLTPPLGLIDPTCARSWNFSYCPSHRDGVAAALIGHVVLAALVYCASGHARTSAPLHAASACVRCWAA